MSDIAETVAVLEPAPRPGQPLVVCEHASNAIPGRYGDLGLDAGVRESHVAWDPGALPLARALAEGLSGALIHGTLSRLLYDCNRPPEAPDAIPARSEVHDIPGNAALDAAGRAERVARIHEPWTAAMEEALATCRPSAMITVHSFTPVYFGQPRATRIGFVHDADARLADAALAAAGARGVGAERNEPYGPEDGVTHTLRRYALPRGLPNLMIEVRNDLLGDGAAVSAMAATLLPVLAAALAAIGLPATEPL